MEANTKGKSARAVTEMEAMLTAVAGARTAVQPQSPEAQTMVALSTPIAAVDPGELSLIALAIHRPKHIVVTCDSGAQRLALEELRGERVLALHGALAALRPCGLPRRIANEVSRWYCAANSPQRAPLWW